MRDGLTRTEVLLLEALQRSPGIATPEYLYQYGKSKGIAYSTEQVVRAHISNIRGKLGFDIIRTHRGVGYSLTAKTICPTCKQPYGASK